TSRSSAGFFLGGCFGPSSAIAPTLSHGIGARSGGRPPRRAPGRTSFVLTGRYPVIDVFVGGSHRPGGRGPRSRRDRRGPRPRAQPRILGAHRRSPGRDGARPGGLAVGRSPVPGAAGL